MKIVTTRTFEAAHQLKFLPSTHKCSRLHGHSYEAVVEIEGPTDTNGMLVDYGEIAAVIDQLDHRYLNEIDGLEKPTTEAVAEWIAQRLQPLAPYTLGWDITVRVYEGAHRHFAEVTTKKRPA